MDVFEEEIKKKLIPLTYEKKLLFALLTCEKLYPHYVHFQKVCNWGNSGILLEAIEMMFQSLFRSDLFDSSEVKDNMERIDMVIPDTEDFIDGGVSFALDACTAVYSSLNFMLDHNIEHIVAIAIYARDTVYATIIERDDLDMNLKGMDERVSNDVWMLREISQQYYVIDVLANLKDGKITDELIHRLKEGLPIIYLEALE